jgi:hypothetical protein
VKVKATFEPKGSTGVAHLENLTPRPITVTLMRVHTFDAKEVFIDEHLENVRIDIEANAKADAEIGHGIAGEVKLVDVYVASFSYRDGKQEKWENQNLSAMFNSNMKKRQR